MQIQFSFLGRIRSTEILTSLATELKFYTWTKLMTILFL